jgi:phage terminase Nu1 subunit (DNA packaging protein)
MTSKTDKTSKTRIAQHIDLSPRAFRRLIEEGMFGPVPPGGYDIDSVRVAYIRKLRAVAAGRSSPSGEVSLVDERAKLTRVNRERAQLELSVRRNQTIEQHYIIDVVDTAFAALREQFLALPGEISAQLVGLSEAEICAALDAKVAQIFESLYSAAMVAQQAKDAQLKALAAEGLPPDER